MSGPRILTSADLNAIVKAARKGMGIEELTRTFRVGAVRVREICAESGVKVKKYRAGRRPDPPAVLAAKEASDARNWEMPKPLQPWPGDTALRFDASGRVVRMAADRGPLRKAHETQCPLCKGNGFTIIKNVMDACAACAARARVQEGEKHA